MHAIRASHAFDGTRFLPGGATVLVEGDSILGVEKLTFVVPSDCATTSLEGTLLPGLFDVHTHLVTDSGPMALSRVAGYTDTEIEAVVTEALRRQLAAGVTTVRDLGDRDFCVVERRDRGSRSAAEPRIVASGPPLTTPTGHCHFLGGEVSGPDGIRAAVRDRAERGVDVVKVMASGGLNTPGTDVMLTQFSDDELRLLVDEAHDAGLPVTAHAHGTPSVAQALAAGVDGIEHCSAVTDQGFGDMADVLVEDLARSGVAVCPTLGVDMEGFKEPPPVLQAMADRLGTTVAQMVSDRSAFVGRLHRAGVRIISGVDSGIAPPKAHGVLPHAVRELLACDFDPAEALASATSAAADACGLADTTGRLRAGLAADLLVVGGDLATDLGALHRVALVVSAGQPVT